MRAERNKQKMEESMKVFNKEKNEEEKRMTKDYLHYLLRSDFH